MLSFSSFSSSQLLILEAASCRRDRYQPFWIEYATVPVQRNFYSCELAANLHYIDAIHYFETPFPVQS